MAAIGIVKLWLLNFARNKLMSLFDWLKQFMLENELKATKEYDENVIKSMKQLPVQSNP